LAVYNKIKKLDKKKNTYKADLEFYTNWISKNTHMTLEGFEKRFKSGASKISNKVLKYGKVIISGKKFKKVPKGLSSKDKELKTGKKSNKAQKKGIQKKVKALADTSKNFNFLLVYVTKKNSKKVSKGKKTDKKFEIGQAKGKRIPKKISIALKKIKGNVNNTVLGEIENYNYLLVYVSK